MTENDHKPPLVTVLMPVFNCAKYLDEAIQSVLNQTFNNFELLIINDGSTDKSANLVKKYKDRRIRFVNNKKHQGLVSVLNQGLRLVRGKYLARMDGDDISVTIRLEKQVKFMDTHPQIDICGTWFEVFGPDSHRRVYTRPLDPVTCKASLLFTDPVCHASAIMRTAILKRYHLRFDPNFRHLEDYEFFNRAAAYLNFGNIGEVLYLYRYHDKRTGEVYKREQKYQMKRVIKIYLKKLGIASPEKYINLHWSILTGRYKADRDFLIKAQGWLLQLITTNKKSLVYDPTEFRKVIDERWAIVYRAYRSHLLFTSGLGWLFMLKRGLLQIIRFLRSIIKYAGLGRFLPVYQHKRSSLIIPALEKQIS